MLSNGGMNSQNSVKIIKAVILVGGPAKGTRFRPLSLDLPKPLFPIAGHEMIYHHIEACSKIPDLAEIILIGFYQYTDDLQHFIYNTKQEFKIQIKYLQEYISLGTAGGLYHFRDQILGGSPGLFFVMNSDICCDFPLKELLEFHRSVGEKEHFTIMTTEATRQQSIEYGSIVEKKSTHEVIHFVEKPSSFVSTSINCGVYVFEPGIFKFLRIAFLKHQEENYRFSDFDFKHQSKESISLEREVLTPLAGCGKLYTYHTDRFWSQIKSPGSAIYANRHKLESYRLKDPCPLAKNGPSSPTIIGDVYIHPTATVDPTATIGPNVSIGKHAVIGRGSRLRECIVLQGCNLREHCCIINAVLGWNAIIGEWARVEGTPNDPNPNKPFTKMEILPMFNPKGQLNPSITVIGSSVEVPPEIVVLNSVVLPNKELRDSLLNRIIL